MKCKQVMLRQDDGAISVAWVDENHALQGMRYTLDLGDGTRSPVVEVMQVWDLEVKDLDDLKQQEHNRRAFGGSIR
jgi:hypothetical protein